MAEKRIISGFKTFYDETETSISVLIKQPVITKYSVTCENKASVINITEVLYGKTKPSPGDFPFTLHCWADYTGGFDKFGIPISKPDVIYTAVTKFPHKITNFYFSKEAIVMAIDSAGNRSQPVRVNQIKGCYCFDFTYKYLCDKDTLTITLLAQGTYFVYVNDKLVIGDAKVNANGTLTIPNLGLLYGDKQTHTIKIVGKIGGLSCTLFLKIYIEICKPLVCIYDCEKGLICTGDDGFEIIEIIINTGKEESLGVFSSKDTPIYLISNIGFNNVVKYRIINIRTKASINIIDIACCEYFTNENRDINQVCDKIIFTTHLHQTLEHELKASLLDIASGKIVSSMTSKSNIILVRFELIPTRNYKLITEDLTYKSKTYKNKKAPYCENEGQNAIVYINKLYDKDDYGFETDFKAPCLNISELCDISAIKINISQLKCSIRNKSFYYIDIQIIIKGYHAATKPYNYTLQYINIDTGIEDNQIVTFVNSSKSCTASSTTSIRVDGCKTIKKGIKIKSITLQDGRVININHTITAAEIRAVCCTGFREDEDQ